ncbi:filamentous hemagglutinin N-terminal domain-containing protein [Achromobacter sp. B7]|uniref:two-partner secretion domain-containing protein n=1 Tax=Achromobacter sp. B7 TaxID=2282475 RepID=UPI000E767052|nr:hemagglutinin repeat-containing protein [Achromobacter sp. B7]AYD67039.1 filamentous hemagglutinin N-terminal domain-containing protein [Achromobacter sp. B7]
MMSKLRSMIVWSVVFLQVWSPVLAQTLPITVDKSVAGAKPSVGATNGVPVINIAPPTAGGVSNNRYTQFNVGPSGAVLNNSGGASQTQLAGQVGGNIMLGNQRATTILNQVTAPNPSQLLGTLEVAGNRANVIVANPAGITCNGCGFLNADRATLTTGRPLIGADGRIGFDIASGNIRVDGAGLNGGNLGQVDLLARSLEINAGVWADRLNVTAGAARVDYDTGIVTAQSGQGAKPDVALDTAALGGMYANSIRLIGTEAGVGVNIGGNLVALTGDLHVNAAGDVRITPSGTVQAAGALRVDSGGDLAVQGVAQAAGATMLAARRDTDIQGAVAAGGSLNVTAGKRVIVGSQGGLRTQDALRVTAGQDLALSGHLLTADQNIIAVAGRNLKMAGLPLAGVQPGAGVGNGDGNGIGDGSGAGNGTGNANANANAIVDALAAGASAGGASQASGVISANSGITLQAGRDLVLPRQIYTSGTLLTQAGANMVSEAGAQAQSAKGMTMRAGVDANLAGAALTDGALSIGAGRNLRMDGSALAYGGGLALKSGNDLRLGQTSRAQGAGIVVDAGGDVRVGGDMVSGETVDVKAAGSALLGGTLNGKQGIHARTGGALSVSGAADADQGAVTLASGADLSVTGSGSVQARGPVALHAKGALNAAGTVSSMAALTAQAARDAKVSGKLLSGGPMRLQAAGDVVADTNARLQSEGAMTLLAGQDLSLAGEAETNATLKLNAGRDLRIDGAARAYTGAVALNADNALQLGKTSRVQGDGVSVLAGGDLVADGSMASRGDMAVAAGRDVRVGGQAQATGKLDLHGAGDVTIAKGASVDAERSAAVTAGQDIAIAGALRSNEGNRVEARGALRLDGETSAAQGALELLAGGDLLVGKHGKAFAGGTLLGQSGGALTVDGALSSRNAQRLTAASDIAIGGQLLSGDTLSLRAGQDLGIGAAAQVQSTTTTTLNAGRDANLAGTAVSDGSMAMHAVRDLNVDGAALAYGGALELQSGKDLRLGASSQAQGLGVAVAASRDLHTQGEILAQGPALLTAGDRAVLGGKLAADGELTLRAAGAAQLTGAFEATGSASLSGGEEVALAGSLRSNLGTQVDAARKLDITGAVGAAQGAVSLASGSDLTIGASGHVHAAGPVALRVGGGLSAAGTVSSMAALTAQVARDAWVDGKLLAGGNLLLDAVGKVTASAAARLQSEGAINVSAGKDLALAGEALANAGITLDAGSDLRIDGTARAYDGALTMNAGNALRLGASSGTQGAGISAQAGSDLHAAGTMGSRGAIDLAAGRDVRVDSTASASGNISLAARHDLSTGQTAQWYVEGASRAMVGNDMTLSGAWRGNGDITLAAIGALTLDGELAASVGGLDLSAGRNLSVGALARIAAAGPARATTDGDLLVAGTVSSLNALTLQAARNASIGKQLYAGGALDVQAGHMLAVAGGAQLQSDSAMALKAGQDLNIVGTAMSEGSMALTAARDLRVDGDALAYGGTLALKGGNDVLLGSASQLQGQGVQAQSGRDLAAGGVLVSKGDAQWQAGRDIAVDGKVGVDGSLDLVAKKDVRVGATGQLEASANARLQAAGAATIAGAVRGDHGALIQSGGAMAVTGTTASAKGPLQLIAGQDLGLSSDSQTLAGGALLARAGASLIAAGTLSSLADAVLDAGSNITLAGQSLATGAITANAGGVLAALAGSRLQADGSVEVHADSAALSGTLVAGQSAQLRVQRDLAVDGTVLADAGTLAASSGGDMTLGSASELQAGGKLLAQAGGKLRAAGTLSGETDIAMQAESDAELSGKTVANGTLEINAGRDLTVADKALAQGSRNLLLTAGQDLRIAGTAGTAEDAGNLGTEARGAAAGGDAAQRAEAKRADTEGTDTEGTDFEGTGSHGLRTRSAGTKKSATTGGTLSAQAGRDLSITDTGTVTAGSPIALKAARDINIDGIATALAGTLQADAGAKLQVGALGRMQASDNLAASAGTDLDSDGVIAAGGGLTLAAGGSARLGGVVAALGERAAGDAQISAQHDLTIKQGGQVQAAGALSAHAGQDLSALGALSSVADMALTAARDVRVDGTVASDANLTLTGRNLTVAATGLAQAGGTLAATAQEAVLVAGRMLAGHSQSLIAGNALTVQGTVAALNGDLTMTSRQGDVALDAASTVQSSGMLTADAGAALRAQGSLAAGHGMTLRAGTDAALGGVTATQAGDLNAFAAHNMTVAADGRLQSAGALTLKAGGTLANAGVVSANDSASVSAGAALLNQGSVLAGGDLLVTTPGMLDNAGRLVAGMDGEGALNQPGSLTLKAGHIVHRGTSLAGKDLTLAAGNLDLAHGALSAVGNVTLATPGDIDAHQAVVQGGGVEISAANLNNQAGKLTSTGAASLTLAGTLDNTDGLIAAAGDLNIAATTIVNREGTLAGGNLVLKAIATVDNRAGLIQADNALTLTSGSLDNSATLAVAGGAPKGVLGKVVAIVADRVDNQGGSIQAGQDLTLTTRELDNQGGEVAAQGNARIVADTLKNGQGKLLAGNSLTVIAQVLHGLGTLQSAGDLSFQYAGALNQTGDLSSGRDLNLSLGGALDNSATISAGRDLSIQADSLVNHATGQLLAGGGNTLNVTHGLTNAGLIDGAITRINAGGVDNLARIYGDKVAIQTHTLVNSAGVGGGAVIASRGAMDLGVASLVNRDHALIYAGADLSIGGALDAGGNVAGYAGSLLNSGATIEAAGNARISAASLLNQNAGYSSQTAVVSSQPKAYFTPAGSTDMYDAETNWLCDEVTPQCSKDPAWLDDDPERMFLLPSDKYPAARYGPPFDYTPGGKRKAGVSSPIALAYTPADVACSGGDAGGGCWDVPEWFGYGSDARIWSIFGITPPSGSVPIWIPPEAPCFSNSPACLAEGARRKAYEAAHAAYTEPYKILDARIREFNADFRNRLVGTLTYYQVNETVTETRTLSSDPGKILSGGAMTLAGAVTNDKSQIAAGGALHVAGPAIHNIGAGGQRTVVREGTATVSQARSKDRKEYSSGYTATLAGQAIELPVGTSGGHTNVALAGSAPGNTGIGKPGPVLVASLELPGGTVVRTVSNPASIPDNQLFTVDKRPDVPYLVATDPRFVGQRPTVSSDYLFDLLRQPDALPGTTVAGGAGAGAGLAGPRPDKPADADRVHVAIGNGAVAQQAAAGPAVGAGSGVDAQRLHAPAATNVGNAALDGGGTIAGNAVPGGKTLSGARLPGWDALLPPGAKFLTPSGQPKRLGDGFYEQKLVSDQILSTTGLRFLDRFGDNDSQYKALMAEGAKFARANNVQLGVALTDEQQRRLTSDLVWLVEQTVTLPDGSTDTVLVPKVYLVVRKGDLKGDGTLMAGRDVKLAADGDIVNSGTIGARHATVMSASNIVNRAGGLVQGAVVDLAAREDLTNLASLIQGDSVTLKAGRDIALASTAASENFGNTWGSHVTGVARVDAGDLNMRAGRDISLTAAQVNAERNAGLQAGRDINLSTVTERHGESIVINKKNRHDLSTGKEIGSSIAAGGNLTLIAGQDVNARAADVTAGKKLAVGAGRDINLTAGVESGSAYDELHYKKRGFLSSKTTHIIKSADWEQAKGSTFTGDTALLMAGRDLRVAGSNVGAQNDLVMSADRDVNILAGQNAEDGYDYKVVKKSGFGAMGGLSYGTSKQTDSLDSKKVFHNASTVGSVEGDVLINAGSALNIKGSNVIARQGDITLIGKEVNIGAALDTTKEKEFHEIKQTGLSINANTPLVDAMQTAGRMGDAAGRTDNKVMQGLALATTGLAAANAYDAVAADPKSAGGVSVSINFGVSKSQSTADRASSSVLGSTVAAGQDLTIVAKGAGSASDVTVTGSRLSAGSNAIIKADGDILLQAAQNTFEQHTKNKSYSGSVGIGVSANSEDGIGVMLNLSAGGGRGRADGKDANWTYTDVTAGNVLALQSGGDTSLIGAIASADQIIASVGKNLQIETLQDTSTYVSKQQSAGVQASICIYGYCKSSVSGNVSQGRMESNFQSATQQAGMKAGDGGFLVNVGQNTTLTGGVISSSEQAVADGLNQLSTGTLVVKDLQNTARYKADQVALSGGYSWGGSGEGDAKKGDVGTNSKGQAAGGADKVPGTSLPTSSNGASAGLPVVVAASGNANSTTYSAISGGSVAIRDGAGQLALTGKTAAETIAALNRDTSDTLNALKPIFDKEKIEAGFEIASEAQRQVGQFLTNRAKEADALKKAIDAETDPALKDDLKARYDEAAKWGPNGAYRLGVTAISAGAGGNVTGSAGQFLQSAAANYLQALGAGKVKQIADTLDSEAARTALQGLVGCAAAFGQGSHCGAGAAGAAASVVLNNLIQGLSGHGAKDLTAEEKESRANLVASLVAGLTVALGGDSAVATLAAQIETENNYFGQKSEGFRASEQRQFDAAIASCGPGNPDGCARARELSGMSAQRDKELASACVDRAASLCRAAIQLATASGNVVFFDKQGKPLAVPAGSPMIQATPDLRDGTWHYTIAASVAEGLAIDSGGGALSGIGSAIRGLFRPGVAEIAVAAKGAGDAASLANVAKLSGQLTGREISGGHAFEKHVIQKGEYKDLGITTREQFALHIESVVNKPTAFRELSGGRTAYWDNVSGTVVIRNPKAVDGGTAFRPVNGKAYFDGLR